MSLIVGVNCTTAAVVYTWTSDPDQCYPSNTGIMGTYDCERGAWEASLASLVVAHLLPPSHCDRDELEYQVVDYNKHRDQ